MIRAYLFLILVTSVISCTTRNVLTGKNSASGDVSYFTILYYGYPNGERLRLEEMISEKWKIKYKAGAGCVVNSKMERKIEDKNRKTYVEIEKKYGKDWKMRYEKDINEAAMAQADIMDVLITNKPFREELEKHHIEIDGVDKEVLLLDDPGTYEVEVYGFNENNEQINCCRLHVNTKNKTVYLIK
ncbi:hypothetical protein C1631_003780 [Chryseobacterium phosphatilyticum]|uniref:Lipoprotein n=1 Tax=Chryseobacterium phosphatilyticum TaxID=475075 RepID=A0A316XDY7_9FLAO|nr:hypothetical protein [Chryseobacterium phosphatilyticum]PWN71754.1 hypothetical protein C1631_003780 [Chryseobacterium phosphatilyticum]